MQSVSRRSSIQARHRKPAPSPRWRVGRGAMSTSPGTMHIAELQAPPGRHPRRACQPSELRERRPGNKDARLRAKAMPPPPCKNPNQMPSSLARQGALEALWQQTNTRPSPCLRRPVRTACWPWTLYRTLGGLTTCSTAPCPSSRGLNPRIPASDTTPCCNEAQRMASHLARVPLGQMRESVGPWCLLDWALQFARPQKRV